MQSHDPQARERMLDLLRLDLGKEISYDDFRIEFEDLFNFKLDRALVSEKEFEIFQHLFDRVVWYSPFPHERAVVPNYIGEVDMDAAVAEARHALGLDARGE